MGLHQGLKKSLLARCELVVESQVLLSAKPSCHVRHAAGRATLREIRHVAVPGFRPRVVDLGERVRQQLGAELGAHALARGMPFHFGPQRLARRCKTFCDAMWLLASADHVVPDPQQVTSLLAIPRLPQQRWLLVDPRHLELQRVQHAP